MVAFFDTWTYEHLSVESGFEWHIKHCKCPSCQKRIFILFQRKIPGTQVSISDRFFSAMVYPSGTSRSPVPPEVPQDIASDYSEACMVLSISPKASAALSRRCLQHLLRNAANVPAGDLYNEIQDAISNSRMPSYLADQVDQIRKIGNMSAHPMKSKQTGMIVEVEPHEAEWTLDVLELLFDFYYVQPAIAKAKAAQLVAKVADAKKN